METGNIVDGDSEDTTGSKHISIVTVESKSIKQRPKFPLAKFAVLWGIELAQQDFEKYLIYFLISNATSGCEFDTVFASWLLVNSIITFPWSLISGWITDYTQRYQNRTLQVTCCIQTVLQLSMILLSIYPNQFSLILMSISYQMRQATIVQCMCSIWKLAKIQLEVDFLLSHELERDALEETRIISRVGNYGDMVADVAEIIGLGMLFIISKNRIFSFFYTLAAISAVSLCYNVIVLLISFNFRDIPDYLHLAKSKFQAKHDSDEEITVDEANTEEEVARILPAKNKASSSCIAKCKTVHYYLKVRFQYMIRSPIVLHATLHALVVLVVYCFVEYPIALGEADDNASQDRDLPGFCGGYLTNLLMQGAYLSISFFVGSILYGLTLVKCPPTAYYKWVLPLLLAITGVAVGILLLPKKPAYLATFLVAVGQIVPYYMNAYDYYIFTTYVREEYYGFLGSIYNFSNQIIYNITAILLSNNISLSMIIISCVCLSGVSLFYGWFIYRKFKAGEGTFLK